MAKASVDEILDFAIQNEQNAVDLYTDLATKTKSQSAKKAFEEYAAEERGHKAKFIKVKEGKKFLKSGDQILDLKISDYVVEKGELGEDPDYQDILLYAMKMEKAAFKLYTKLAGETDDESLSNLLLGLAQEEAKHKLRFEIEYDDHIYQEN